ncbi:hypothetical protein OM076_21685 [Solirubrobacter ginsenosidimutans]|uniref:Uncharacterized protein n=1 Tax=Solirubrobacter ginsenosidimutans TaxID=490573 RepID=A0A9X3S1X6_9ACTN|nr:hypothetical protein [Solirubrobacter ginsenosidimutans]MDA0162899.1 hypothetical protein [Solirubrobacter ginsenosidimutans]
MTRDTPTSDAAVRRQSIAPGFAATAIVVALLAGAYFAMTRDQSPSVRHAQPAHLTTGPDVTLYVQGSDGAYRVSSQVVTMTEMTPTPTPTPSAIAP